MRAGAARLPILDEAGAGDVDLDADPDAFGLACPDAELPCRLVVTGPHSRSTLPAHRPEDYPSREEPEPDGHHVVERHHLDRPIRTTRFAVDPACARYQLGGCSFDLAEDSVDVVVTVRPSRRAATVTVEAACSKHRRKDVLQLHPRLAELLPSWMDSPRTRRSSPGSPGGKTWLLVKRDLERIGIPYETAEGAGDFHASARHSHVTGLLRNGASITEARELVRHSDVRITMKYTRIGLEDRGAGLAARAWLARAAL